MAPEDFWQKIEPGPPPPPPYVGRFPAALPGGEVLWLPLRPLEGTETALASLILNQASFSVAGQLAALLAEALRPHGVTRVVGLPTLGLGLAAGVAEALGHGRYLPLGTSRKFWYDEALSEPLRSVTSPGGGKRLYIDPRMLPLLKGARVAVIDDAVSTGTSMVAALDLLDKVGAQVVVVGAAMLQTERWKPALAGRVAVEGVFHSPLLEAWPGGYAPVG
ncbi:phosphoribosyltransferase [Vannielia litorea]|nr:phosphoribosyltransferase [Vannielia litorea]MBY6073747.1 phosphoribosyltransferase [Vannielia litorea]